MARLYALPQVLRVPSAQRYRHACGWESGWRLRQMRVPVHRRRASALRVSPRVPKLFFAPAETIERSKVGPLVPRERTDAPSPQSAPIDLAWKPLQSVAGLRTENPPCIRALAQPTVDSQLRRPSFPRSLARRDRRLLQLQERPRYEQKIACPSLKGGGAGEEQVRVAVADARQP